MDKGRGETTTHTNIDCDMPHKAKTGRRKSPLVNFLALSLSLWWIINFDTNLICNTLEQRETHRTFCLLQSRYASSYLSVKINYCYHSSVNNGQFC